MIKLAKYVIIALCLLIFYFRTTEASELRYQDVARSVEQLHNLPPGLLQAICYQESRWRNLPGQAGEIGICQIKPNTIRKICQKCAKSEGTFYLVLGSKGKYVEMIQQRLRLPVSGLYDQSTKEAVINLQKNHRLLVDGIVGPETWRALFKAEMPGLLTIEKKLWNPIINIHYAGLYLAWLRDKLETDNVDILAAAYNGGDANMTVRYMLQVRKHYGY